MARKWKGIPLKDGKGAVLLIALWIACGMALAQSVPAPPSDPGRSAASPTGSPAAPSSSSSSLAGDVAAPVDPNAYRIGPGDVVSVRVWREPELTGQHTVRPDGKITLPLAGDVQAANLTPAELTRNVTDALGKFINSPEVTVSVSQVLSKKYYITGEVNRTGAFPLVTPTTVLEALSGAGGFREFANTKNIIILRGNKRYKFNYKDIIKGKNLEQNIYLQDGDYIIVP